MKSSTSIVVVVLVVVVAIVVVVVVAVCPALAPTVYLYRHNLVAQVLHWHLSLVNSLPMSSRSWYTHKPMPILENSLAKLLWDFGLVTESSPFKSSRFGVI